MNITNRIYAKGKPSRLVEGFPFCLTAELPAALMPPHRDANGGPVWIEYRKFDGVSRKYMAFRGILNADLGEPTLTTSCFEKLRIISISIASWRCWPVFLIFACWLHYLAPVERPKDLRGKIAAPVKAKGIPQPKTGCLSITTIDHLVLNA
jgi:hypothetical protein